jgi:hypothetical protein
MQLVYEHVQCVCVICHVWRASHSTSLISHKMLPLTFTFTHALHGRYMPDGDFFDAIKTDAVDLDECVG